MRVSRWWLAGVLGLVLGGGCSAAPGGSGLFQGTGGADGGEGGQGGAATGTTTAVTSTAATTGAGGDGGGLGLGAGGGGAGGGEPEVVAEVFAHSPNTLYRLEPTTKVVTKVGAFTGCPGSVIDLALDRDGAMFATTFSAFVRVDKATAACTVVKQGAYPNSLSFVPQGTIDPNRETLVGYNGAKYVRIDVGTGALGDVGVLGGGYRSSGDIVSVIGGGAYLTVTGNGCGDCIVEVNPTTGAMVKLIGKLDVSAVYGLAFWAGAAYGFSGGGRLFAIDLANAATTTIPMPDAPAGLTFYGAGSTTAAPLMPPE